MRVLFFWRNIDRFSQSFAGTLCLQFAIKQWHVVVVLSCQSIGGTAYVTRCDSRRGFVVRSNRH